MRVLDEDGIPALGILSPDGTEDRLFVFLQRKGNPHDIVFAAGAGPRLHHAAFGIPKSYHFFHVCDLASDMGFAANINMGRGDTVPAMRCSSTCATRMDTASNFSTPITR